ncbi:hypothetical protein [Paenibacillus terrae]|uniref:Lipoprotein n=1 Tax=Paenibacillus terrae TaxID=159743 RepID=A0A0D7X5G0_9BACL|nr:hypothetical protein [Paenibacillus terrae]KJD46484.1 hypothetical protein QD47_05535 [Paenibacillus terrae]
MRLICLVLLIILASCSNVTDSSTKEASTEYENVQELNNLPVPSTATEVDGKSSRDLKNYKIHQSFENFNASYQEKLKGEGWGIIEVESNKVISVEKNNIKYLLIITKSSDTQTTNVTVWFTISLRTQE